MTINWFSSLNAMNSDTSAYFHVIQSVINAACPTSFCSLDVAAARVVRISWQNLFYLLPSSNQSIVNIIFIVFHFLSDSCFL